MHDEIKGDKNSALLQSKTVGILGAGQLAHFLAEAAQRLGASVEVLQSDVRSSDQFSTAGLEDRTEAHKRKASACTWIAIENEGQAIELALSLDQSNQEKIHPSLGALETLADKGQQKVFLQGLGIPTAAFEIFKGELHEIDDWLSKRSEQFPKGFVRCV